MRLAALLSVALAGIALVPGVARAGVLWDQLDHDSTGSTSMVGQIQLADDFTVTVPAAGQFWLIDNVAVVGFSNTLPATFKLGFLADSAFLPAVNEFVTYNPAPVVGAPTQAGNTGFSFALNPPLRLQPGRYWLSVQGNPDPNTSPDFAWIDRTLQKDSAAAARGPLTSCSNWGLKTSCTQAYDPDLTFRLQGTIGSPPAEPGPPADTTAPGLGLGGARRQSIGDGAIDVRVQATSEAMTARGAATVSVPRRLAARTLRFRSVTKSIAAGARSTLKLRLSRKSKRTVLGVLRAGRRATARVTVTATDAAGNRTVSRRALRLTR